MTRIFTYETLWYIVESLLSTLNLFANMLACWIQTTGRLSWLYKSLAVLQNLPVVVDMISVSLLTLPFSFWNSSSFPSEPSFPLLAWTRSSRVCVSAVIRISHLWRRVLLHCTVLREACCTCTNEVALQVECNEADRNKLGKKYKNMRPNVKTEPSALHDFLPSL